MSLKLNKAFGNLVNVQREKIVINASFMSMFYTTDLLQSQMNSRVTRYC